jgi:hypothetical protein
LKKGVREAFKELKERGAHISISSCRTSIELFYNKVDRDNQKKLIESFLIENKIPFDEVLDYTNKPIANYYIDDRAIKFENNWDEMINKII